MGQNHLIHQDVCPDESFSVMGSLAFDPDWPELSHCLVLGPSSEMTKCQDEAGRDKGKIGSFKPQCDEQGGYKPRQCWTATGFCWCVDKSGKPIEGTASRGWPQCA